MTKKLNSRFGSRRHLPPRQPRRRCLDGRLIGQPILRSVIHLGNKNQVEWCNAGNKYASPNIKSSRSNSVAFTYPADRRPDGTFLALPLLTLLSPELAFPHHSPPDSPTFSISIPPRYCRCHRSCCYRHCCCCDRHGFCCC